MNGQVRKILKKCSSKLAVNCSPTCHIHPFEFYFIVPRLEKIRVSLDWIPGKLGLQKTKLSGRIYFPFIPLVFFSLLEGWGVKHPWKSERRRRLRGEFVPSPGLTKHCCSKKENANQSGEKRQEVPQEPSFVRSLKHPTLPSFPSALALWQMWRLFSAFYKRYCQEKNRRRKKKVVGVGWGSWCWNRGGNSGRVRGNSQGSSSSCRGRPRTGHHRPGCAATARVATAAGRPRFAPLPPAPGLGVGGPSRSHLLSQHIPLIPSLRQLTGCSLAGFGHWRGWLSFSATPETDAGLSWWVSLRSPGWLRWAAGTWASPAPGSPLAPQAPGHFVGEVARDQTGS